MIARIHHAKHAAEICKFDALLRFQRVRDEEWDDVTREILQAADPIGPAVAMVRSHDTTAEEITDSSKELYIALVLHDGEFRKHLITASHFGVLVDADMEAALTIHEACYPSSV